MKQFNLEEYLKNPNKKVVTGDGRSVKIHCTNYVKDYPVIAEIEGSGESHSYTKDGTLLFDAGSSDDLFFAPEKHEGWANIYGKFLACDIFSTKEEAEEYVKQVGTKDFVTTAKIEWEE